VAKAGTKALNMNINAALLDRVDRFRFKRMFSTRSEAVEFLLDTALKINPERPKNQKVADNNGSDGQ
jgi:metal-responsive CopG/Arc/MetJ family transcriptional regulator